MKFSKLIPLFLLVAGYLFSPQSFAAPVDGQPTFSPQSDAGLFVWRMPDGSWKVRLAAGGGYQKFTGVFEATESFNWVNGVELESNDVANQSQPGKLTTKFRAWNVSQDGINFGIASGAGICLRGSGSTVYLGANAVRVNTPVDLTGTGACGVASAPPTSVPPTNVSPPVTGGKYNPGHYVSLLRRFDSQKIMLGSVKPGVVGFLKRYTWRDLEPSQGNYDFSEVASDLALVASQGLQLVIMIEDKTFTADTEKPLPPYLSTAQYSMPNKKGGYTAVRWSPYVVTRMKALLQALGQRFDSHPNFEGVIPTEESAPSVVGATLDAAGYTPEKYRDALIDILTSAAQNLPNSRVFWYMNFMPRNQGYLGDIADAVKSKGVIMGGPDVMPDDHALTLRTYPFYDQVKGTMRTFGHVEGSCYRHLHKDTSAPTKYWTMAELFRYGRDRLNTSYMFWVRLTRPSPADSYDWTDALPVIANNPVFNQ